VEPGKPLLDDKLVHLSSAEPPFSSTSISPRFEYRTSTGRNPKLVGETFCLASCSSLVYDMGSASVSIAGADDAISPSAAFRIDI
jgi:hypothetical protein